MTLSDDITSTEQRFNRMKTGITFAAGFSLRRRCCYNYYRITLLQCIIGLREFSAVNATVVYAPHALFIVIVDIFVTTIESVVMVCQI